MNIPTNPVIGFLRKTTLTIGIAAVWLANGLLCKVLNLVPRHQLIVSRLLGETHARITTFTIGVLEVMMFVWIVSRIKSRLCAWTQMVVVAVMNVVEFIFVPDLLLFGRANAIVAALFIGIIYYNEYKLASSL